MKLCVAMMMLFPIGNIPHCLCLPFPCVGVCVCVLLTNSPVTFSSRRQKALQSKYARLCITVFFL